MTNHPPVRHVALPVMPRLSTDRQESRGDSTRAAREDQAKNYNKIRKNFDPGFCLQDVTEPNGDCECPYLLHQQALFGRMQYPAYGKNPEEAHRLPVVRHREPPIEVERWRRFEEAAVRVIDAHIGVVCFIEQVLDTEERRKPPVAKIVLIPQT